MANGRPTLAEIYGIISNLDDSYQHVLETFQSVVQDVQEIKRELAELRDMMRSETADAITSANIWKSVAEAHKAEIERLRVEIDALKSGGC